MSSGSGRHCGRCGKNVYSAEERLGLGKSWHVRCFTCAICSRSLDSWSLAENRELNEIFCKTCYRVNFATQGYGYGANEPTLLALPQGIRSSSSSSLIVVGSRTKNYKKLDGDSSAFKNITNTSQYSRPTTTTAKQVQDDVVSKYASDTLAVTKTTKHKGNRRHHHHHQHTHRSYKDHNNNKQHIICYIEENDPEQHEEFHHHHHHDHHIHKHRQKQDSPPQLSSSHSSASSTSTIIANRAPNVEELKANYRTHVETRDQDSLKMRNDNTSTNTNTNRNKTETISRSDNSGYKRCSRGKAGSCYVPAPRYPPKHPEVHRLPLYPPTSFKQGTTQPKGDDSWRYEKKIRNEVNRNDNDNDNDNHENNNNNLTLEVNKLSSLGKSKVKVQGKQHQSRNTSKNFGGGEPCRRCGRPVYWAEMKLATAGLYHNECFSCCCCGKNVESTTVSENQGEIFCKGCYRRFFGVHGIGFNNTLQTP